MGERTQRVIGSVDGYEQPLCVRHGKLPPQTLGRPECHLSNGKIFGYVPTPSALARLFFGTDDAHCRRPAVHRMLEDSIGCTTPDTPKPPACRAIMPIVFWN